MGLFDGAFPEAGSGGILPYGLPDRPPGLPDWLWRNPQRLRPPGLPDWLSRNPQSPSDLPPPNANEAELPFADRWGPVRRAMEPGSTPSGGPAFRTPDTPSSPEWLAPYVGAD